MVVGWSVSRKQCDEVSFPESPYMVVGSLVSRKQCDEVFLNHHIWSLDCQCHGLILRRFPECYHVH